MKKYLVLLLWPIFQSASAQNTHFVLLHQYLEQDSLSRPGYAGIRIQETRSSTKWRQGTDRITETEWLYDKSGRLTEEEHEGGNVVLRTAFHYDSLPDRPNYIVRTGGKVKQEAFARYDDRGRLIEVVSCQDDKPCTTRHYVYDEDNVRRVYVPRNVIGLQFGKEKKAGSIFGFSTVNREKEELVQEIFFDPEGKLEEIRNYVRDTFSIGWTFDYNATGQKTKAWLYNSIEKKLAFETTYDASGLPQTETMLAFASGSKIMAGTPDEAQLTRMEYDENKRLKRTEQSSGFASVVREYFYTEY